MNVIISIGRGTPTGDLDDKAWGDYVNVIAQTARAYGFVGADDCVTFGRSTYRDGAHLVTEDSVTWAFILTTEHLKPYLIADLEECRRRLSGGQWGIAVTFGNTVMA